jgi:hypothetical protein
MTEPIDPYLLADGLNYAKTHVPSEVSTLVAALAAEVERLRAREWRNMPDSEPCTYLGYKQPGAAPFHYGPDDVVVDGDWLQQEIRYANLWRSRNAQDSWSGA